MKRISLFLLGLCTIAWTSGCCCHSYYSRYSECSESYACNDSGRTGKTKKHKHRHRGKDGQCEGEEGCSGDGSGDDCDNCCNSCCNCEGNSGGNVGPQFAPVPAGAMYGNPMPMMASPGCAGGNCAQGAMMQGSVPMSGGCASGNCGAQTYEGTPQTFGSLPFDSNSGWTIQSTTTRPVGSEPVQAPPSSGTPTPVYPPAQSSSPSNSSAPVPPPVSYNR